MRAMLLGSLVALSMAALDARAQEYTLTDIGTLGGDYAIPHAVNNAGQVVGQSELPTKNGQSQNHPFLYSNGAMKDLGTLGSGFGEALAFNNQGQVVGDSELPTYVPHAFLWSNGSMQDLDPLEPDVTSAATGITPGGQIVGAVGSAAVTFSGGTYAPIPPSPLASFYPNAINSSSQSAGTCFTTGASPTLHACRYNGTSVIDLPPLFSGGESTGSAINELNQVCGSSDNAAQTEGRATLWKGITHANLGVLSGGHFSRCDGLNNYQQQVGSSYTPADAVYTHAVLYDPVNKVTDLNSRVAKSKYLLLEAFSISDNGKIAVWCEFGGFHYRVCLLNPNLILILKKNIFALAKGDPGCIQCSSVLLPEARSLPDTLQNLTSGEKSTITSTVSLMIAQLQQVTREKEITVPQSTLLQHQAQLVLNALKPR